MHSFRCCLSQCLVQHSIKWLTCTDWDIIRQLLGPLKQPIDLRIHIALLAKRCLQLLRFICSRRHEGLFRCSHRASLGLLVHLLGKHELFAQRTCSIIDFLLLHALQTFSLRDILHNLLCLIILVSNLLHSLPTSLDKSLGVPKLVYISAYLLSQELLRVDLMQISHHIQRLHWIRLVVTLSNLRQRCLIILPIISHRLFVAYHRLRRQHTIHLLMHHLLLSRHHLLLEGRVGSRIAFFFNRISLIGRRVFTTFHLQEHTVHFLHFGYPLFVFLNVMRFLLISCHLLPWLYFLHERCRIFASFVDTVDSGRVYIIRQRWWIKLFEPIFELFTLSKL